MFNLGTGKKSTEPSLNSAVNGKAAVSNASALEQGANKDDEAQRKFIDARVEEIESQRIEFMKKNPDFDMKAEMENPDFVNYVWKNGLSVEDAYFLVHRDEIIGAEVKEAMEKLSAKRNRITENGAGKNSPAVVKKNPKDMSDKEIDSIIDRVLNGEKISF